jgi:predicted amidophosphoribosyltransferase
MTTPTTINAADKTVPLNACPGCGKTLGSPRAICCEDCFATVPKPMREQLRILAMQVRWWLESERLRKTENGNQAV